MILIVTEPLCNLAELGIQSHCDLYFLAQAVFWIKITKANVLYTSFRLKVFLELTEQLLVCGLICSFALLLWQSYFEVVLNTYRYH